MGTHTTDMDWYIPDDGGPQVLPLVIALAMVVALPLTVMVLAYVGRMLAGL